MGFHTVRNGEGRVRLKSKHWVEMTNVIGIFSKSGDYGIRTFVHEDIAFEERIENWTKQRTILI